MEVSTEISQKIRSAIKAKLMELGAYVDDELPDYIMVMVANKKSRAQMSHDLGLFLGANTETFTGWLHGLLCKLQTISVDSGDKKKDKAKASKEKKKDRKEGKEKKSKKRSSSESKKRSSSVGDKSDSNSKQSSEIISKESDTETAALNNEPTATKPVESVQKTSDIVIEIIEQEETPVNLESELSDKNKTESTKSKPTHEDVEDVRQLLVTVTQADELAEELETTEQEVEQSRQKAESFTKLTSTQAATQEKETKKKETVSAHKVIRDSLSRSPSPEKNNSSTIPRKRKIPTSVVASVRRGDEEEYDPYNPAVGSVASVVKVTTRKSSVPASLQANRETNGKSNQGCEDSTAPALLEDSEEPPSKIAKYPDTPFLDNIKQALEEVIKKSQESLDDVSHFSKMVESSLRKLNPLHLSLAKMKIQKVLFDLETLSKENFTQVKPLLKLQTKSSTMRAENIQTSKSKTQTLVSSDTSSPQASPQLNMLSDTPSRHAMLLCNNVTNNKDLVQENENILTTTSTKVDNDAEMKEDHTERIIFHPKLKNKIPSSSSSSSKKSSQSIRTNSKLNSRSNNTIGKINERRISEHFKLEDQKAQSPVSTSKVDTCSSPTSAHSCPPSSTSESLAVRRCIVSTSNSTLSPSDSKYERPTPGPLRFQKTSISKPLPSIVVDSIHSKKRPESESTSVLKQLGDKCKSLRGTNPSDEEGADSPHPISSEVLKVMAKNLKVTVINKRANLQEDSSSEDSSTDDEDEDDSSNDEESETKNSEKEETGGGCVDGK